MKRAGLFVLGTVLVASAAAMALARPDAAVYGWKVTLTVPMMDPQPNDAHLIFTGTGGSIKNVAYTMGPPGAATGGSNMVDIVWDDKVPAGTVVMVTFTTAHPNIAFNSGTWTNNSNVVGNIQGSNVVLERTEVPTLSEWGLIVLGVLMVGGGAFAVRRFVLPA